MEAEPRDANTILNSDLESLERKIKLIGTSDPEKYKEFMDRLKAIQDSTLGMTRSEFDSAKFSVIDALTALQFEFDGYMNGTDFNNMHEKVESGKTKIKKHQIGLYRSIVDDLKKLDEIDIESLNMLRRKWDEEKVDEYLDYLPIEASVVEEAISEAFLEYQIKYIKVHNSMPEAKVLEYTSNEEYKARIMDMLLERSKDESLDPVTRLDIEKYLKMDISLDFMLKDDKFWKILTKKDTAFTKVSVDSVLEDTKKEEKQSNLPALINDPKSKHQYAYGIIKKKSIFGKEKEKEVKFKVKNGYFHVPKKYKDKLISAVIPEGITQVGWFQFSDCINLEEVLLPETIETIGKEAFKNCVSLRKIHLPNSVKEIEEFAFSGCENLEDVNIGYSLNSIGEAAFENTAIRKLDFTTGEPEIPEERLGLGKEAFKGCRFLESVKLSRRTSYLAEGLFRDCERLKEFEFAKGLKGIGESVFRGCKELADMSGIPDSVSDIGSYAFEDCEKMTKFKMPTFLKYMSPSAIDHGMHFDRFLLPKQLMNVEVLKYLDFDDTTLLEVPNDGHGYLYEILGINPGDKVSCEKLKLLIAEKYAKEKVIEPTRVNKMQRYPGNRVRMKSVVENPPVIVGVEGKDLESNSEEEMEP